MNYFIAYILVITVTSIGVFVYDKYAAIQKKKRIKESTLHLLELAGGVFSVIFLMYIIRHKNRKSSYYFVTYLILLLWVCGFILYAKFIN